MFLKHFQEIQLIVLLKYKSYNKVLYYIEFYIVFLLILSIAYRLHTVIGEEALTGKHGRLEGDSIKIYMSPELLEFSNCEEIPPFCVLESGLVQRITIFSVVYVRLMDAPCPVPYLLTAWPGTGPPNSHSLCHKLLTKSFVLIDPSEKNVH